MFPSIYKYHSSPSSLSLHSQNPKFPPVLYLQANVEQFNKVVEGFKSLGFRDDELDSVYRILASVINLGDVDFYQTIDKDNMEQAAVKNVEQIKVGEGKCKREIEKRGMKTLSIEKKKSKEKMKWNKNVRKLLT